MKKIALLLVLNILAINTFSQTNTFPTSGNVGIGVASPAAPLHVEGNLIVGSTAASTYHKLIINGPNTPNNIGSKRDISFEFAAAGSSLIRSYRGSSYDTYLQFLTTPNATNTPVERMHIHHDGNVGIGTTTPGARLEVSNTSNSFIKIKTDGDLNTVYNGLEFSHKRPASSIYSTHKIYSNLNDLIFEADEAMQFKNNDILGLYLNNSGNVAIGTTTVPTGYKLAIDGNLIAEKIVVKNSTTWPDFVFKKGYNLPSLNEVEQFISENSHLPEIPSAGEVESKGQDVGEMNRLLLKKVEEITLYLIELKKENQEMKQENKGIKKENDSLRSRIESLEKDKK